VGVSSLAHFAGTLWCLGYPDQALETSHDALVIARELGHPLSLADTVCFGGCLLHAMRRDAKALQSSAEELVRVSEKAGLHTFARVGACYGYEAIVWLGQAQDGIALLRRGLAVRRDIGTWRHLAGTMIALAEAQAEARQLEEGLATLSEALAFVERTGERHWEAELYRLRGELLLARGDDGGAEASLLTAVDISRRQNAKSWELRASTSLARLWQISGRTREARELLAPVYGWFTEGFDTPDLKEAEALLAELA
jgi:predicted ATPase